jgi:glycosyltransferase involved in cell wall biosynthesis
MNIAAPRLVLNMIVKNESSIIERLIRSVLPIIDAYCISDTGSTDNTREIIRQLMDEFKKPGEVYDEPFQNFGYNRTHALERAERWGEYALLLDADMKLVILPEFSKEKLVLDGYYVGQYNSSIVYSNMRIIRLGKGVKCLCPTHEYYDFPPGLNTANLTSIKIEDIGDGGCKTNKFTRDIELLNAAIEKEPDNPRYHFYLAQSYKDLGQKDMAIKHYKRRVEIGGWIEEVFMSLLELGHLYMKKDDSANAISCWLEAYDRHPTRAESLAEICKHYRIIGHQRTAYMIWKTGSEIPYPKNDKLFISKDIYSWFWYYEYSILAYYTKTPIDHWRYLSTMYMCPYTANMMSNLKFYACKLTMLPGVTVHTFNETVKKQIDGNESEFISSTPSLMRNEDGTYLMNVRFVNYRIRDNGSYIFANDSDKISTLQKRVLLDTRFNIILSSWIDEVHDSSLRYQGVEDVKVYRRGEQLRFLGTVQTTSGIITLGEGPYEGNKLLPTPITSPLGQSCEKNWVDMGMGDGTFIYSWKPLRIGNIIGDRFHITQSQETVPECFRDVRGSSNGVRINDELWFVTHVVSYEQPRWYYHMIVILDASTREFKRHSILFKFTPSRIEFSLGLSVEADRVCISYSTNDATSSILCIPRKILENTIFN